MCYYKEHCNKADSCSLNVAPLHLLIRQSQRKCQVTDQAASFRAAGLLFLLLYPDMSGDMLENSKKVHRGGRVDTAVAPESWTIASILECHVSLSEDEDRYVVTSI